MSITVKFSNIVSSTSGAYSEYYATSGFNGYYLKKNFIAFIVGKPLQYIDTLANTIPVSDLEISNADGIPSITTWTYSALTPFTVYRILDQTYSLNWSYILSSTGPNIPANKVVKIVIAPSFYIFVRFIPINQYGTILDAIINNGFSFDISTMTTPEADIAKLIFTNVKIECMPKAESCALVESFFGPNGAPLSNPGEWLVTV